MIIRIILLALLLNGVVACKSSSPGTDKGQTQSSSLVSNLPVIDANELTELKRTVNAVDLTGLKTNVTMSFDNPQAIAYILSFISGPPGDFTKNCTPDARIALMVNGTIVKDADVFFMNGCSAVIYMDENNAVEANGITPEGIDFFKNFLKPVSTTQDTIGSKSQ